MAEGTVVLRYCHNSLCKYVKSEIQNPHEMVVYQKTCPKCGVLNSFRLQKPEDHESGITNRYGSR